MARSARAESTWVAYTGQWRRFEAWCARMGERARSAHPLTVAQFLTDLAPWWRPAPPSDPPGEIVNGHVLVPRVVPGSLAGYLAAISVAHQSSGVADSANPTQHPAVRQVLAGIRRHPTIAPTRRRTARRPADVAAILATLEPDRQHGQPPDRVSEDLDERGRAEPDGHPGEESTGPRGPAQPTGERMVHDLARPAGGSSPRGQP